MNDELEICGGVLVQMPTKEEIEPLIEEEMRSSGCSREEAIEKVLSVTD